MTVQNLRREISVTRAQLTFSENPATNFSLFETLRKYCGLSRRAWPRACGPDADWPAPPLGRSAAELP